MNVCLKKIYIFWGFFLILLSLSDVFDGTVTETIMLYMGYLFILVPAYVRMLKRKTKYNVRFVLFFGLLLLLISFGVLVSDINLLKKVNLIVSYMIMISFVLVSGNLLTDIEDLRVCSYAIFFAFIIATVLAIATNTPYYTYRTEDMKYAFTAGLGHKNYSGAAAFAALTGIYINKHFGKRIQGDTILLFISLSLIIVSQSRTVWIMTGVFFFLAKSDFIIKMIKKNKIAMIILGTICLVVSVNVLKTLSMSFYYRFLGMIDYFSTYLREPRQFLLGNAGIVYSSKNTYQLNLLSAFGGMGTTEMGLFNILVRNGFIGLISYILILASFYCTVEKRKKTDYLRIALLLIVPLIVSAFSELYIVSIKLTYTVFCWCSISCLEAHIKNTENKRRRI